jgi:hypothetical protein
MPENNKAYDLNELLGKLKAKGLAVAEEMAKDVVEAVLDWVSESAKASQTPYDDMLLVVLPKVKEFIMSEVDKLDGQASA